MTTTRKYRPSRKRAQTSDQIRQAIKQAAWAVFARDGLEGAVISEIVATSGASTGSFYNQFRGKQALFDEVLGDLMVDIRRVTAAARARAVDIETMLLFSYKDLLDHILAIEGGLAFISRNQHHIRARLYSLDGTSGLLGDLRADLARATADAPLDADCATLAAGLILSNGLETLLLLNAHADVDSAAAARLMTRIIVHGLQGLSALKS